MFSQIIRYLLICMSFILILDGCTTKTLHQSQPARQPEKTNPKDYIVDWTETVELEHSDRKNRLKRLALQMQNVTPPKYYDYVISKKELKNFPVDIPLLRVVFDDRVFFDTGKSELRKDALPIIDLIADSLSKEPPDVAVFVAGHTDSRGSEDYNYNLSVDRANVVAKALVHHGSGMTNIWRIGFGESVPLADNSTAVGRSMNRRVEFIFSAKAAAVATWLSKQLKKPCSSTTVSGSLSCKRKLSRNLKFEAVPVKNYPTKVSLRANTTKVISHESTPNSTLANKANSVTVDIEFNNPIVIDLDRETYSIPEPQI